MNAETFSDCYKIVNFYYSVLTNYFDIVFIVNIRASILSIKLLMSGWKVSSWLNDNCSEILILKKNYEAVGHVLDFEK